MKRYIFGNWKMNLSADDSVKLAAAIADKEWPEDIELAVFPSFAAIDGVQRAISNASRVKLGGQDCFWENKGAFTGEVSPNQLKEMGCRYVLVGHSERRQHLGETDEMVNKKIKAAQAAGLVPVLCVGESGDERRNGRWSSVIEKQVTEGLAGVEVNGERKIIIAYEPIWAIGTGQACAPADAREAHALIMNALKELYGVDRSQKRFSIIYGGSVDAKNIAAYLAEEGIDGALVGGASQKIAPFAALIGAAAKA